MYALIHSVSILIGFLLVQYYVGISCPTTPTAPRVNRRSVVEPRPLSVPSPLPVSSVPLQVSSVGGDKSVSCPTTPTAPRVNRRSVADSTKWSPHYVDQYDSLMRDVKSMEGKGDANTRTAPHERKSGPDGWTFVGSNKGVKLKGPPPSFSISVKRIQASTKESELHDYMVEKGVTPTYVSILPKRWPDQYTRLAKVVFQLEDKKKVSAPDFWPEGYIIKEWVYKSRQS